jgi:oxygen-dependent protoporphyrinogen oxidase
MTRRVDLAVVGAGITGLAAAWEAYSHGADVVVLETSSHAGGKLGTSPVAGVPVDESADAFLARVPDGVELCAELGIDDELVAPRSGRAYVWSRSALRPLPEQQLLGVPTDLETVAASGILSPAGLTRARQDLAGAADGLDAVAGHVAASGRGNAPQAADGDESVGALVRRRLGDEVNDALVAPLIGGIWAGDCDRLSLAVAAPALAEARRRDASLIRGAAAVRATATSPGEPVFLAPRGGMRRLIEALGQRLGDRLRLAHPVEALTPRGPSGSHWAIGPTGLAAESVVVAAQAPTTAKLLWPHAPGAARTLADIEHGPVVLVTLAVPRQRIDHPLDGSGFLVPPSTNMLMTACSWASSKWAHLAGDGSTAILRVSAGRDGDDRAIRLDDSELLAALHDDLRLTIGLHAKPSEVIDHRIGRWHDAFPQPRPGHVHRMAAVEAELTKRTPNLAAAGAWGGGVGIPACIRAGRRAAATVLDARSSRAG